MYINTLREKLILELIKYLVDVVSILTTTDTTTVVNQKKGSC